jgi:rhamnosyltransferase
MSDSGTTGSSTTAKAKARPQVTAQATPTPLSLPSATVTILTWNGETYIGAILSALENQSYQGSFDVLVIDSGSTDGTLDIVARYPSVRLEEIPNTEFGHGRTRNLAAQLSTGDIVVYLTHDAVPADEHWLAEIIAPFADDERIAAVLGKQVARPSAPPVLKYDIQRVFDRQGPDTGITVTVKTDRVLSEVERNAAAFYSDANSAARRGILTGPVPYRDVDYAEDQVFGRDLFDGGYRKAYAARAVVEHSNDTTLRTFGSRIAADMAGLRRIGTSVSPVSRVTALKQWTKWSLVDAVSIMGDPDYSTGRKLYWLVVNPWYHAAKWRAYRRATNVSLDR